VTGLRTVGLGLGGVAVLLAFTGLAAAFSSGPPIDRVGLCYARATCKDSTCHGDFPLGSGTATSNLGLESAQPLPATYRLGEMHRLVLAVTDPDLSRQRFGFQVAVVSDCPFADQAGDLTVVEIDRTQRLDSGALQFVEHICPGPGDPLTCGYLPQPAGENSWRIDWQAPTEYAGQVIFFWSVNAADGNASPVGDFIHIGDATIDPFCPPRVETLTSVMSECDPGAPGVGKVALEWARNPYAADYLLYRTSDPSVLEDPGGRGADVIAEPCDEPPSTPGVWYYTVVGLCLDMSEGPI